MTIDSRSLTVDVAQQLHFCLYILKSTLDLQICIEIQHNQTAKTKPNMDRAVIHLAVRKIIKYFSTKESMVVSVLLYTDLFKALLCKMLLENPPPAIHSHNREIDRQTDIYTSHRAKHISMQC